MSRLFIGVRWWLGAAFAVVAAVSTAIVVSQFSTRSENAFRGRAEQLAYDNAVLAGGQVVAAAGRGTLQTGLATISHRWNLDLYVYDASGRLLARAPARARPTPMPNEAGKALHQALANSKLVTSTPSGRTVVVCALDNLGKGAAGQALQNANLALGLDQTAGLRLSGVPV